MMNRLNSHSFTVADGFHEERNWSHGNTPISMKAHATETTPARARIIYDVAGYLLARHIRLTDNERKSIDHATANPDAHARDRMLKIAAPFYQEELAFTLERLRASSSTAARAYAEVVANRRAKATPAELRILARNCRELAPHH